MRKPASPVRALVLLVATTALLPASARAQVEEGDAELALSGMLMTSTGEADMSAFVAIIGYGTFISDENEAGAVVTSVLAGSDDMGGALLVNGFLTHYFRPDDPKQTPYVGGRSGLAFAGFGGKVELQKSLPLVAYGGMKWWLSKKASLFAEANYMFFLGGDMGKYMGLGDGMLMGIAGLSVLL